MRGIFRAAVWGFVIFTFLSAQAAVVRQEPGRFDGRIVQDPSSRLGAVAEAPEQIQGFDAVRSGWDAFRNTQGASWRVSVDRRSGSPLLVQGAGVPWFAAGKPFDRLQVEAKARQFVTANGPLFGIRATELVWNAEGSGSTDSDHSVIVFDRAVAGVPVEGETFTLYVTRGNLVAFGASRWGQIPTMPRAAYGADTAREVLYAYMGLTPRDAVEEIESGRAVLLASLPAADSSSRYSGAAGAGIEHRLAWRFAFRVAGEPGTWVGKVDAETGKVIAFYDDDQYADVKGGIFPISSDGNCADLGCELPGFPMPYADVTVAKKKINTGDMGIFDCGKGPKNSTTALAGPYVKVSDSCGAVNESGNCASDLDLGSGAGTNCLVPTGHSAGDSRASRTSYYHLNRAKEKARYWLPANTWLAGTLTDRVNIGSTCNAYYNGNVNFYRSGGGCRNTGEIAGVVVHEWGHGLDQNDGGGYDNPSEGYADVMAILEDRHSCVGRGFYAGGGNCSGYGDTCLACSGIRDMDWDQRTRHTPATPANFTQINCGGGGGPCGREVHCESYVPSEAIFDLAYRDLPAAGLGTESSWQLAEKLFFTSRKGSGGNAFNCSLPSSDGCGVTAWFTKLLNADDDDGNLANGTPHAAAIFAAFARHGIACGASTDPSNQSASSCASLAAPTLAASSGAGSVTLSWNAVPGAASYLVLRNDVACDYTSNVIATVAAPSTSYVDDSLPGAFPVFFKIQAQGAITACESAVSACVQASAQ
jgi:hypothetical protein